jgi:hypothetical protein
LDDEELDGYGSEVKTPSKKGAFNKTVSGRIVKTPMSTPRKTGGRAPARTNREVNYTDSFGDNDSDQDVFNATPIKMEGFLSNGHGNGNGHGHENGIEFEDYNDSYHTSQQLYDSHADDEI